MRTSNIAKFEGGTRTPTLLMLERYANVLGKHIEVSIRDKVYLKTGKNDKAGKPIVKEYEGIVLVTFALIVILRGLLSGVGNNKIVE